ncbi:MAG TPA: HDOD domain-containing protein [Ideonella sp.]|nr:HDOD domain-containing protein [Ideonella sp.]
MSLVATPVSTPSRIADELDQARQQGPLRSLQIPPCPTLLLRMRDALAQAEPDLTEIARIAGSDVAMSASLIQAANSAALAAGPPVQTVGRAMTRLGLNRTAEAMTRFLVQRALPVNSPQLQRFWERASKRALAMSFIAGKLPGMSRDLAHTYGLFSHVGMPVMMQSLRGYSSTIVEANARIDRPFIATENANHHTDHAVVGALVARVWRLAPEVMVAIRQHHEIEMLGHSDTDPEVHTLVAAGHVAEQLMRRHEALGPDADTRAHLARALRWLDISGGDFAAWEEDLREMLDEA